MARVFEYRASIRVLTVDSHALIRKGIKCLLCDEEGMDVVAEADNGADAVSKALSGSVDVVVMGITLPDMNGLKALGLIRESSQVPVLILSSYNERQYAMRALQAGGNGYLTKNTTPGELITAIRHVAEGNVYMSPEHATSADIQAFLSGAGLPHESLSTRKLQVMLELARGRGLSVIGKDMHLSVKTISTYRRRILNKLGFATNAQVVLYAMTHNLV